MNLLDTFEYSEYTPQTQETPPLSVVPAFVTTTQLADRHVVIPDIHGEHDVVESVIHRYGEQDDIHFVFLGDLIDRKGIENDAEKGVYRTLESVRQLGRRAIVTMANHEWTLLAAMQAWDDDQKHSALIDYLGSEPLLPARGKERNVLSAYDVPPSIKSPESALAHLQRGLQEAGHLAVMNSMVPYYETDTFIATHAGLHPTTDWEEQRSELEAVAEDMRYGDYTVKPRQWFSMSYARTTDRIEGTDKVVLSGHAHQLFYTHRKKPAKQSPDRSLHGGKRIRLASKLNAPAREPAYVWQDWDQSIVEIPRIPTNPKKVQ